MLTIGVKQNYQTGTLFEMAKGYNHPGVASDKSPVFLLTAAP